VRDIDRMLAEDMARLYADPLGFVRYIFDWGEGDLAGWDGPDAWQAEYLAVLGEAMLRMVRTGSTLLRPLMCMRAAGSFRPICGPRTDQNWGRWSLRPARASVMGVLPAPP